MTVLLALLAWVPSASAQLSRVGVNPALASFPVRGSDVGHDPANNVYLVVGTHGTLTGVFVNSAGSPITPPFQISGGAGFAQYPRVAYSPHANNGAGGVGAFLVTWHEGNASNSNFVNTRIVAYPNRLVSPQRVIPGNGTWWESGAAIAYSTTSQNFFVVWRDTTYIVWGVRIGLDGQALGSPTIISDPAVGSRDPNVAWNPSRNEFGVVYSGFGSSGATVAFARLSASGAVLRRNVFSFAPATYITDLAFNTATGRFVAAWYEAGTRGAEIDANGDVLAKGLLSSTTGRYDALGLSYSPLSGTFLMVGQGPTLDVWAAELNSRGARTSADTAVTSTGGPVGSFYPRAAANAHAREWSLSFSHNFNVLRDQIVRTSSTGGGPAGSLGATGGSTPPPPTTSSGCTTPDPFTAMGGGICVNGGWVPKTSTSGSTGGCTTPSPGTGWTCVNGGWLPPTTSGGTSGGGCTTPDPFTAIGGGTCINGGWIPGGSSLRGTTGGCTTPSPGTGWTCVNGGWLPPSTGGTTSGGCSTPDPFVAMGGGTCINGGWTFGSSGSGSVTGGCTTPDPFVAMGGGTCINGGWTFGSSSSCTTPDPFVAIGGGVCSNGGWKPKTD